MSGVAVLRWIFILPFIILLIFVVATGILLSSTSIIVSNRENVKHWIKTSGLYENAKELVIDFMLSQPAENAESGGQSSDPVNPAVPADGAGEDYLPALGRQLQDPDDEFTKLVDKIVSPQFLEKSVNAVIDGYYDWFDGKTAKPVFNIMLVENKSDTINFLQVTFTEKAKSLPACENGITITDDFDPLSTPCWPAGMDYNEVANYIAANADRPELQTLQNSLKISSDGMAVDAGQTYSVQTVFMIIRMLPAVFLFTVLALMFLITIISPGFKGGYTISVVIIWLLSIFWILAAAYVLVSTNNLLKQLTDILGGKQAAVVGPYAGVIFKELASLLCWLIIIHGVILMVVSIFPAVVRKIRQKMSQAKAV